MSIQPHQTQVARLGNHFLLAQCNSVDSVVVTWASSRFVQTMSAKTWDEAAFVPQPERMRFLQGQEAQAAMAMFRPVPSPAPNVSPQGFVEGVLGQAG